MIQAIVTSSNITVRIWGTKTVDVESVTGGRTNQTSPNTITLPAGPHCVPSSGAPGSPRATPLIITDANTGAEISRNTRTVRYDPVPIVKCVSNEPAPKPKARRAVSPARLPLRAEGTVHTLPAHERSLQLSAGRRRDDHTSIGGCRRISVQARSRRTARALAPGEASSRPSRTAIEIHSRESMPPTVS